MPIKFKLIAAVCSDGGMGYKGRLPWPHCKADMAHFAKRTTGAGNNAVIMGKKTWDSIPARPLRNRANLILSSQPPETRATQQPPETPAPQQTPETPAPQQTPATQQPRAEHWFRTMPDLFAHLEAAEYDEVWIIGGARIYEQFLAMHATGEIHIDEMCVTTMEGQFECDTFFPLQ